MWKLAKIIDGQFSGESVDIFIKHHRVDNEDEYSWNNIPHVGENVRNSQILK